nr:CaiB/BaiF CoA-transferase family protein [bacterium]
MAGVAVVELAGLGPGPFAGMVLADLGADVTLIERPSGGVDYAAGQAILNRGKRSIAVDLKTPQGAEVALGLAEEADILIEGFRPGVAERLGVGPDACLGRNPRLVYGRITGWGQEGPLSHTAGHDINYIAIAGALHPIGPPERPSVPLNLIADYGGGGMLLVTGVLAALVSARTTGEGQVVDAAMVDGTALLTAIMHAGLAGGWWQTQRRSNFLDGAAPFYDVYETSDGRHVAVGCLEEKFLEEMCSRLGVDRRGLPHRFDPSGWPELRRRLAEIFRTKTRDEWAEQFADGDACVSPVLSLTEATRHPHTRARSTFVEVGGWTQPAPAPRFSETVAGPPSPAPTRGEHTNEILADLGLSPAQIDKLRDEGVVV